MQPAHVMSQMMCITFTVSWVKSPQISKVCVYYASTCLPICVGEDYRQNIDPGLLAHCMLRCAHNAAPFYPPEFQVLADHILSDLFLTQRQITVHNCKAVYLCIQQFMSCLLYYKIKRWQILTWLSVTREHHGTTCGNER